MSGSIADVFWIPSADANEHLTPDHIAASKIDLIGHVLIDSFVIPKNKIGASKIREKLELEFRKYESVTVHGPPNVDAEATSSVLISAMWYVSQMLTVEFAAHPRIVEDLTAFALKEEFEAIPGIFSLNPAPYWLLADCPLLWDGKTAKTAVTALAARCLM